ncbi:MAG: hypothetical protein EOP49_33725 [Sphingobacteriales bacterium]|nr:MAG: hypothetical protein EOP49_33725 [Sphingobacteriales bacterium]
MKAKSIFGNSSSQAIAAISQAIQNGFEPTLAIVFMSIHQDRPALCEFLSAHNIDVIGATSAGEFVDGQQSDGAIVLLLLNIPRSYYRILFTDTHGQDIAAAAKAAAATAKGLFNNPAMILCSTCISTEGHVYDGTVLIHSLQDGLGKSTPIFGGMAGDDGTMTGTFVFDNKQSTDEGFIMLLLDHDAIELQGTALSGWKPLGKIRTVTKAEGQWIHTIDDQPALDMYLRYLGQSLQTNELADKDIFRDDIGLYHPFLSIDAGEPSLRTPMEVSQERNAIKLDIGIPEGGQFQFTLPPDFDIIETILHNAAALKENRGADADALLVFSCFGRRSALGPLVEEENEGLHKIWKAPMAGFFSYGEYGKDANSDHVFHSTTCSWVALKENIRG